MKNKFTILGCGSSLGVPWINGNYGNCNPKNKKNLRSRCCAHIQFNSISILIDTSPDLRSQIIKNNIKNLNCVFCTHAHADQTHGINDLRAFYITNRKKINIYADEYTSNQLKKTFGYKSIFFQDYLGGSNSIRGWRIPDSNIYESESFRFGHDYFQTSMEFRYELIPKFTTPTGIESGLSLVLFTDSGFIAKSGYSKHILFGSGFGIRIPFPILGVLRLDYGLGVLNYKVISKALHFGIGHKF